AIADINLKCLVSLTMPFGGPMPFLRVDLTTTSNEDIQVLAGASPEVVNRLRAALTGMRRQEAPGFYPIPTLNSQAGAIGALTIRFANVGRVVACVAGSVGTNGPGDVGLIDEAFCDQDWAIALSR